MSDTDNKISIKNIVAKEKDTKKTSRLEVVQERQISSNRVDRVIIDRDEEDKQILEFQKTGDLKLLEKVYINRIPTLRHWVSKHYYPGLIASPNDLFGELAIVFMKAAEKYDGRASFNTCLFTFFVNRIKNIKSGKYAKKRISEEYKGPLSNMILSLDYSYNDKDGSEVTLKDVIPLNDSLDKHYLVKNHMLDETINILSENDDKVKGLLTKISDGSSLTSLLKEYKTRTGNITVSSYQAKRINKNSKRLVKKLLKKIGKINDKFNLVKYSVQDCVVSYEIELKKTPEADEVMRTIRDLRKNKEFYLEKIKGI